MCTGFNPADGQLWASALEAVQRHERPLRVGREQKPPAIRADVGFRRIRPLPSVPPKVRLLNRLPTLDLGGGDYSSCPIAAIGRRHPDQRTRVDSSRPTPMMGANLHAVEAGLVIPFGFGLATGSNAYGTVGIQILLSPRPERAYSRPPPEA
jgi:hypothetical protein